MRKRHLEPAGEVIVIFLRAAVPGSLALGTVAALRLRIGS
jgi:hypothetical protein